LKPDLSISRAVTPISPWVGLETVTVPASDGGAPQTFHAIRQADYVQAICLHEAGDLVLVRQFRPVLGIETLEFPGGLREADEASDLAMRREVEEETGLVVSELVLLFDTFPDVGRLTNRVFGYFALVRGDLVQREADVTPLRVPGRELARLALAGELTVPSHIGLMYLAAFHPDVQRLCADHGLAPASWLASP
jgi:ADP-ribose pyrophosphatase